MTIAPVFEECGPAHDRPAAVAFRRVAPPARGACARAAVGRSTLRALALVTVAGLALTGTGPGSALADHRVTGAAAHPRTPQPPSPQGGAGPLHGGTASGAQPGLTTTSRAQIIARAKKWVDAKVPYSMTDFWTDGYRQDCSGYVSMAWGLPGNEWTGSLAQFGVKISRDELAPGDILLFHNADDPASGSHATLFGGWTDSTHKTYLAYEQTPPHARAQATPMAYWTDSDKYVPYRYKALTDTTAKGAAAFPGAQYFGPGAVNTYVTQLGAMLAGRGGKRFYRAGPGPVWSQADRKATRAFQRAQGWRGKEADGLPGPYTWRFLATRHGRDIPRLAKKAGPDGAGTRRAPAAGVRTVPVTAAGRRTVRAEPRPGAAPRVSNERRG